MAHYRKRLFKLIHHQKPNISKDTQAIAVNDKDDLFPELCDILNKSRIKNSSLIPGDMASDTFRVAHDDEANKGQPLTDGNVLPQINSNLESIEVGDSGESADEEVTY